MENKSKLENEPNLGRCFKCIHFNKYYTRGVRKFNECKFGWCGIYHDHKKLMDNCPNYRFRRKLPIHQTNIMFELSNLLTELEQIEQILKEDIKERMEFKKWVKLVRLVSTAIICTGDNFCHANSVCFTVAKMIA